MALPEVRRKDLVDQIVRAVRLHLDLFEDDALFLFDVLVAKHRMEHQVREHVDGERQVLVENFGVEAHQFLGGEGIQVAADGIDRARDIFGRTAGGALEEHVLDEMRDAVLLGFSNAIRCRSRCPPRLNAHGHRFGDDTETVGENGALNSRGPLPSSGRGATAAATLGQRLAARVMEIGSFTKTPLCIIPRYNKPRCCNHLRARPDRFRSWEWELPELQKALGPGQPPYRARQLFDALYRQVVKDFSEISTLPKTLKNQLLASFVTGLPIVDRRFDSIDGTRRYLLRLADSRTIESVVMPEETRDTICISSQVGCPVDCRFCLTALMGLERSLTAGEIVGQVLLLARERGLNATSSRLNVVMMGMGEPLLNLDNVLKATRLLTAKDGF